jgi:hypothetical protein
VTFIKRVEDFTCIECGFVVQGNGFTNHCPRCLHSVHVDREPGDRLELCGGVMEPVAIQGSSPNYQIIHECRSCKVRRVVRLSGDDDMDRVVLVIEKIARAS